MTARLTSLGKALAYLLGFILIGAIGGLLVKWLSKPYLVQEWMSEGSPVWPIDFHSPFWESIVFGSFYATTLCSAVLGSRYLAYRFIPIHDWKGMVLHIGAISCGVVCVYFVMLQIDPLICLLIKGDPNHNPPESITAVVALGGTLLASTILYAVDFYRDMRKARRTALLAELSALKAQINPHFLFNTLNSIAALIHSRPHEAEHMVQELSELFRYTLRASQHASVTLREDLRAADRYLAIEQARFRDRMIVSRSIEEQALDAQIPSLIIQPLVENAVKHGVAKTEDTCGILIEVTRESSLVRLCVRDTGPGFSSTDPETIFSLGTGLANVRDRLLLNFPEKAAFIILHDGVELTFPYRSEADAVSELFLDVSESNH